MNLYRTANSAAPTNTVVALGCFDGVHKGHRAVLNETRRIATEKNCDAAVWTFEEPPKSFFMKDPIPLLTSTEEKCAIIESLGMDHLFCIPFDLSIAQISAEDFFYEILLGRLHAIHLVCGFNYSFGARGLGNVTLLEQLCHQNGIGLSILPPVLINDLPISSSLIRKALQEGRPEEAANALTRPYSVTAPVVNGQKLARRLGFPTVNQILPLRMTVPRYGVYLSRVRINGKSNSYFGITNIGMRPTVGGTLLCAETHLFDFDGDLYGSIITTEILTFLRDEKRYDSLEALTEQVRADIAIAKDIVATNNLIC